MSRVNNGNLGAKITAKKEVKTVDCISALAVSKKATDVRLAPSPVELNVIVKSEETKTVLIPSQDEKF